MLEEISPINTLQYRSQRLNKLDMGKQKARNIARHFTEEMRHKLFLLKDRHKGERCFILGASPSLSQLDLSKLNNEFTFTANRAYKLSEMGLMHSSCHMLGDVNLLQNDNILTELSENWAELFFVVAYAPQVPHFNNILYFNQAIHLENFFQVDITLPLKQALTIIYNALEIAAYMGFAHIILLGVDLDFAALPGHAYVETHGEKERQRDTILHAGKILRNLEYAYHLLKSRNVSVLNASPHAPGLPFMEKVAYDSLF